MLVACGVPWFPSIFFGGALSCVAAWPPHEGRSVLSPWRSCCESSRDVASEPGILPTSANIPADLEACATLVVCIASGIVWATVDLHIIILTGAIWGSSQLVVDGLHVGFLCLRSPCNIRRFYDGAT